MRIEIVRPIGVLQRERYEFIVRVDSLAIRVNFTQYRREYRESLRHRKWHTAKHWAANPNIDREIRPSERTPKPDVPIAVQVGMKRNLELSLAFDYTIDYFLPEDDNGIRN